MPNTIPERKSFEEHCSDDDRYQQESMKKLIKLLEPTREKINKLTLRMVKYDGHLCNQSIIWKLNLPVNSGHQDPKVQFMLTFHLFMFCFPLLKKKEHLYIKYVYLLSFSCSS